MIRRITLAALVAALVGGSLAMPASSKPGPVAHASKCKKGKKGKHKKKKCKRGRQSGNSLPGQATHPTPTQPTQPVNPTFLVSGVGVAENPVLAGDATSGQVTISAAAPAGGQPVTLQSSDPTRVMVPASVVVAAGQTTATFAIDTTAGAPVTATLTAAIGSSNANTQLSVVSDPSVSSVALEKQCFPNIGSFSGNRVTLDVPAPADTPVALSSDDPISLTVLPTVTVPSGSKSAFFGVTTLLPTPAVTVTATLSPSFASDSASVSLSAPDPTVSGLSLQPNSLTAGNSAIGTVTLDCEALSGGTVVNLSSDLPGVTVPSTVTVPQDKLSATFQVNTLGTVSGTATISATTGTGGSQQATLQVNDLGT